MRARACVTAFVALSLSFQTAGCSGGSDAAQAPAGESSPRQFDEASKRAARALSISQTAALGDNAALQSLEPGDEYGRAVLCASAIDRLSTRFEQTGILNAEQLRVLARVQASYDRLAAGLADGDQRTRQSIVRDYRARLEANAEVSADALLAMNCLQEWQAQN